MNKNDQLESLRSLIISLTKREFLLVQKQIVLFSSKRENQSLKLLLLLQKDKAKKLNKEKLIEKLYPQNANGAKAFRMLKERLKFKIFEYLTLDINIENKLELEELELVSIQLRKKMSQFYFLSISKSNSPFADELLDDIINKAKEFEAFQILTEALYIKKYRSASNAEEKEYNRYSYEIEKYEESLKSIHIASDVFFKMYLIQHRNANPEKLKYKTFLKLSYQKLESLFKQTGALTIQYYMLVLKRNYYVATEEIESAINICKDIIDNLKNNKAVYRRQRIGSAYLILTQCLIIKNDFTQAKTIAAETLKWYIKDSENYGLALDLQLIILISTDKLKEAIKFIVISIEKAKTSNQKLRLGKLNYYYAIILNKMGQYNESRALLIYNSVLIEDKTGWGIGYRMLMIQNHIELEHYDQASAAIEALRKHMTNKKHDQLMRQRDVLILKIMRSLSNASFNFKQTRLLEAESLKKLESKDSRYAFEFFCHEMFPFQEWFAEKTKS